MHKGVYSINCIDAIIIHQYNVNQLGLYLRKAVYSRFKGSFAYMTLCAESVYALAEGTHATSGLYVLGRTSTSHTALYSQVTAYLRIDYMMLCVRVRGSMYLYVSHLTSSLPTLFACPSPTSSLPLACP